MLQLINTYIMKKFLLVITALAVGAAAAGQNAGTKLIYLDGPTNGATIDIGSEAAVLNAGEADGCYADGQDRWVTLVANRPESEAEESLALAATIEECDIAAADTLYIYDGPSCASPLLLKTNNLCCHGRGSVVYASAGVLTVRFRTAGNSRTREQLHRSFRANSNEWSRTQRHTGFRLTLKRQRPCSTVTPVIDTVFGIINLRTGATVGHRSLKLVPTGFDTIFASGRIVRIDTAGTIWAAQLCQGEGAVFHGHGEYSHVPGQDKATDETSDFLWTFDTKTHPTHGRNYRYEETHQKKCAELRLAIVDENGCMSQTEASVQVQVAKNPIQTIFDLGTICSSESLTVRAGYEGDGELLTLRKDCVECKGNCERKYIPDGDCRPRMARCYTSTIHFDEYEEGRTIESAEDIYSICINYEHSYMQDYSIAIRCPLYDERDTTSRYQAFLKQEGIDMNHPSSGDPWASTEGTDTAAITSTGIAGIPSRCDLWEPCDSTYNPYGIGLDYCWSRRHEYTLVTGDRADVPQPGEPGDWYISIPRNAVSIPMTALPTMPSNFRHPGGEYFSGLTRTPSNPEEKSNYYTPTSDFSELIGCPLNGDWTLAICDNWGGDNGWVFSWSIDLSSTNIKTSSCDYTVGIDSVVWTSERTTGGTVQDVIINKIPGDNMAAVINSMGSEGEFGLKATVYDDFGCTWDTMTHIRDIHSADINLGPDTSITVGSSVLLDARDSHYWAGRGFYMFRWEPHGETSSTLRVTGSTPGSETYIAHVENREGGMKCLSSDTITITVLPPSESGTANGAEFGNAITPDGDGINDRFTIKNLIGGTAYADNKLEIYDRTGTPVYRAKDIRSEEQLWDPNLTKSPAGTYYYIFTYRSKQGPIERKGAVEVIR